MSDTGANSAPSEDERIEEFDTATPIELDIGNSIGSIDIELTETARTRVEVRHDPGSAALDWRDGVAGLLHWVSRFTEAGVPSPAHDSSGTEPEESRAQHSAAAAVQHTRVDLTGNRLVVRAPAATPLRTAPIAITIRAPQESQVGIRTQAGPVTVTGPAGRLDIHSGTGAVSVEHATARASVRSGSGALRLAAMRAEVHAHSGSGDIEVASVGGASSMGTSTGKVWLGEVGADVLVRTGSGDVTVAEAVTGHAELFSGSGELRISIRQGVAAEVDLTSSTGTVDSDLSVSDRPPEHEPALRIFGRTGSGSALLTSAM